MTAVWFLIALLGIGALVIVADLIRWWAIRAARKAGERTGEQP